MVGERVSRCMCTRGKVIHLCVVHTDQPMKLLARVLEKRIRCQVAIDDMHFGFLHDKGTIDAIFIMRQVVVVVYPLP